MNTNNLLEKLALDSRMNVEGVTLVAALMLALIIYLAWQRKPEIKRAWQGYKGGMQDAPHSEWTDEAFQKEVLCESQVSEG